MIDLKLKLRVCVLTDIIEADSNEYILLDPASRDESEIMSFNLTINLIKI